MRRRQDEREEAEKEKDKLKEAKKERARRKKYTPHPKAETLHLNSSPPPLNHKPETQVITKNPKL